MDDDSLFQLAYADNMGQREWHPRELLLFRTCEIGTGDPRLLLRAAFLAWSSFGSDRSGGGPYPSAP
jgi:hypothetical protein